MNKRQMEAIRSGMNPGLTMVVGPPGTGKTDVAVQIISNLYHALCVVLLASRRFTLSVASMHACVSLALSMSGHACGDAHTLRTNPTRSPTIHFTITKSSSISPGQRILLVTHSNAALNDLFEKTLARDVDPRHLLRLGKGAGWLADSDVVADRCCRLWRSAQACLEHDRNHLPITTFH